MRVLICEPQVPGHHLHYVSLAARAALTLTDDVVVGVAREAAGTFWFEHFLRPLEARCRLLTTHPGPRGGGEGGALGAVRQRLSYWSFFERYLLDVRPDHVILPSGDRTINVLSLLPKLANLGAEIEVVLHSSLLARRGSESVRARLREALLRSSPVSRIHLTDPTQFAAAMKGRRREKFRLLPDAVEQFEPVDRTTARERLGLPQDRRLALMVSPAPFKGAVALLKLFLEHRVPSDTQLVLSGTIHPVVQEYLERVDTRARDRVIVLSGRTDEIDLHHAICAADLVVARLSGLHGTTAMCIRASLNGRRFFSASSSWVDAMARQLHLGDSFDAAQPSTLAAAFNHALDRAGEPLNADILSRLRQFHSEDTFVQRIAERLRERRGRPLPAAVPGWDWVSEAVR
jgi:hypothetical protein